MKNVVVVFAGLLLALARERASGQSPESTHRPTRVPVTVAIDSTLPPGTPFRIVRRSDVEPYDVVLFRSDSDPAAFTDAIQQLIVLRQVQGDTALTSGVMRVRSTSPEPSKSRAVLPWAARVLDDLHHAVPRAVAGVGNIPALVIWLPPQHARATRN